MPPRCSAASTSTSRAANLAANRSRSCTSSTVAWRTTWSSMSYATARACSARKRVSQIRPMIHARIAAVSATMPSTRLDHGRRFGLSARTRTPCTPRACPDSAIVAS
jgi:hypothetical protein